jgi:Domain of unknown function (DU1801)
MHSPAKTVAGYLKSLPPERRAVVAAVRDVILANLDDGYVEGMQYGMIGYAVPHSRFPQGYHTDPKVPLPFAALAAQKNAYSLYLMGVYCGCDDQLGVETAESKWFRQAWTATGKKLDMGKACVRFKRLEDVPLDVVGEAFRRIPADTYVAWYEKARAMAATAKRPAKRAARS